MYCAVFGLGMIVMAGTYWLVGWLTKREMDKLDKTLFAEVEAYKKEIDELFREQGE